MAIVQQYIGKLLIEFDVIAYGEPGLTPEQVGERHAEEFLEDIFSGNATYEVLRGYIAPDGDPYDDEDLLR